MKRRVLIIPLVLLTIIFLTSCNTTAASKEIIAFAGSASETAMEEAAAAFKQETGITVYLNWGGSGTVLSQLKISKSGDLYIPGSPDYMVIAERDGVIYPDTIKILAYLVPSILVQKGNPKNIRELADLAKPGIKVGIANPETVCVGLYAVEIMDYNGLFENINKNIVTHAESCSKTASLIALKSVDAVIGWDVFSKWHPDTIEAVYLKPDQIPRLAYIPAAVSKFTKNRDASQKFIDFLVSPEGQQIFSKNGYYATEAEARKFAPKARIGGEYELPAKYKRQ